MCEESEVNFGVHPGLGVYLNTHKKLSGMRVAI